MDPDTQASPLEKLESHQGDMHEPEAHSGDEKVHEAQETHETHEESSCVCEFVCGDSVEAQELSEVHEEMHTQKGFMDIFKSGVLDTVLQFGESEIRKFLLKLFKELSVELLEDLIEMIKKIKDTSSTSE